MAAPALVRVFAALQGTGRHFFDIVWIEQTNCDLMPVLA